MIILHTIGQKDCNTFFSMGFGMQFAHRLVLIHGSINKNQSLNELF